MYKTIYVWEFPVRLTHWLNVVSIAVLSITGFYIGRPFIQATVSEQYIMGWVRFLHFVAAYVFTLCFVVRIYWAFAGNAYARWKEFIPVTAKRWKDVFGFLSYYLFLRKKPPFFIGHSALAGIVYAGLFLLFFVEIVTGFALYSQCHQGTFWQIMGGWLLPIISSQTIRFYHHLIMWLVITFFVVHKYTAWIIDIVERGSTLSSIFSGFKTIREE